MQGFSTNPTLMRLALLLGTLSLGVASEASATSGDLYDRYFSNVLAGPPCFARTYDDAHLKAHPAQRVRSIEIDLSKTNSDGSPNSPDRFELGFALMLATTSEWYGQSASCKASDTAFECFLEADGGLFRLTPAAGGGLRLETGEAGITIEGASDTIDLSGTEGGDRVFDLLPSKGECDAARAFFEGGNE
jgi:hypothetical protein